MKEGAKLIKRFEEAKERRNQNWWNHMRECYQYGAPQRETFFHYSPGQQKNNDIFDDTAVLGTERFASRLQSDMVPPWQQWSQIVLDSSVPEEIGEETVEFDGQQMTINEALELTTDIVFDYIHRSNFDTKIYESFVDLAVSTGNLTEEYDAEKDQLVFNALPLPQTYLEAGPDGSIETHWREHEIELEHVKRLWPRAEIDKELEQQITKNPNQKKTFVEGCIYVRPDEYRYVVIYKPKKKIILDESDESSAFISFRSSVTPSETYGRGRLMSVLPSIKTLNLMAEYELTSGAIAASGVWTSASDGLFNPYNVQIAPGIVIPVQSNDSRNPSLAALPMNFDFQFTQLKRDELQQTVNKALFANPIGDIDDPTRTLGEIMIRKQMDLQESGGFFARLFTELITKVMKRTVFLLGREGKIPNIRIGGGEYTLKHTSPLAKAMDLEDVDKLDQTIERLKMYDETGALLAGGIKVENIPNYVAKKIGLDPSLVRTQQERDELAQKTAEEQSRAQEMDAREREAGISAQEIENEFVRANNAN